MAGFEEVLSKGCGSRGDVLMIFVTVGTHEQPFDRVVRWLDQAVAEGELREPVVMQIGHGRYEPQHCQWQRFFSQKGMAEFLDKAEVVVCHGGPATFMSVLDRGKVPLVVPRLQSLGEHVNDHQLEFALKLVAIGYEIVVIGETERRKLLAHITEKKRCQAVSWQTPLFVGQLIPLIRLLVLERKAVL